MRLSQLGLVLAISALLFLGAASRANATGCGVCPPCDPPGSADRAAAHAISTIDGRLDALDQSLTETIRKLAGQNTASVQQNAVANGKVTDAHIQAEAQIASAQTLAKVLISHRPSPSACQTVSVTRSAATSAVVSQRQRLALDQNLQAWNTGAPSSASSAGLPSSAAALANYRLGLYCPPYREGNCPGQAGRMPDADVLPGSTIYAHDTLSDSDSQKAAADLVRMTTGPMPAPPTPLTDVRDPEKLHAYLIQLTNLARKNLAVDAWNAAVADRTPATDSTSLQAILAAAHIPTKEPIPAQISRRQLFALDVARRYENPQWQASLGAMDAAEVSRESVRVAALDSEILLRIDDKLERIVDLLATMLSKQVDSDTALVQ